MNNDFLAFKAGQRDRGCDRNNNKAGYTAQDALSTRLREGVTAQ